MKRSNFLIFSIILCLSFVIACKSDKTASNDSKGDIEKVNEESYYTAEDRRTDSLGMIQRMSKANGEVDQEELARMLAQNAQNAQLRKSRSKEAKNTTPSKVSVPPVCSIFTPEEIAELFDVGAAEIKESSGNKGKVPNDRSRSCFWRWSTTGILLQVSMNPFPDEVDDWCTRYINTKKSSGEKAVDSPGEKFKYVDFDGPGTANIYNEGLGRYYVTQGEKYVISLIFNGNIDKRKQKKAANKILARMYANL